MEKMDSESRCQHPKKVFCLITTPKIGMGDFKVEEVPWICKDCGEEGVEVKSVGEPEPSYGALKAKKARGGFGRR